MSFVPSEDFLNNKVRSWKIFTDLQDLLFDLSKFPSKSQFIDSTSNKENPYKRPLKTSITAFKH